MIQLKKTYFMLNSTSHMEFGSAFWFTAFNAAPLRLVTVDAFLWFHDPLKTATYIGPTSFGNFEYIDHITTIRIQEENYRGFKGIMRMHTLRDPQCTRDMSPLIQ